MQDRIPTPGQEGRVLITPEDGQAPYYAKMEMADNPIQPGTPLNKQTLLTDVAAGMYGLDSSATVNDAFMALAIGVGKKGCLVTVVYPDGSPAQGYTVQGATGPDGETLVTDASGNCLAVTTGDSLTLSIPDPAELDVEPVAAQQVPLEGTITTVRLELSLVSDVLTISSSVSKPVSKFCVSADFCGVGGGGGGSGSGAGGGGGHCTNVLAVDTSDQPTIAVLIGAAGSVGNNFRAGGNGGATTVQVRGATILTANGGEGGTLTEYDTSGQKKLYRGGSGNGNGGDSTSPGGDPVSESDFQAAAVTSSGKPATVNIFNDSSLGIPGGGGGGAYIDAFYYKMTDRPNTAGAPYGAMGAIRAGSDNKNVSATAPTGPGGGGGGGDSSFNNTAPTAGAAGAVFARFHREAA